MRLSQLLCSGLVLLAALATTSVTQGGDLYGLSEGTPKVQTAGHLAFAPNGILLIGDAKTATIYAVGTGDLAEAPKDAALNMTDVSGKVAAAFGVDAKAVSVTDLAVNPMSGNAYLSATIAGKMQLVRVGTDGKVAPFSLENVRFAQVTLPNPPADKLTGQGRRRRNQRMNSITDLTFIDGKVIVAGLSGAEKPTSTVREMEFPFNKVNAGTNLEIFHAAHGRLEDYAPVQAFVPFNVEGKPTLLAGFTCTPLVSIPLEDLMPGKKIRGKTVAELGNRNRPLDMIAYKKDGSVFLLAANSARGVMKISTEKLTENEGLNKKVSGTAGQPYETIESLKNVVQLAEFNKTHAVVLIDNEGELELKTIMLP